MLAEEGNVVSVGQDQLETGLSKEATQVSSKHSLKESSHWNHVVRSLGPAVNNREMCLSECEM